MNILYIWNGENELSHRLDYIMDTYKLYPDAKYYCVSKSKEFLPFAEVLDWDTEKEKMRVFFGLSEYPSTWDNNMVFSDWYRFYFLINNPDTLFLDTDCKMLEYFDFTKEDKVFCPKQEIFLLYSPLSGNFAKIKTIIDRIIRLKAFGILLALGGYIERYLPSKILDSSYYKHK